MGAAVFIQDDFYKLPLTHLVFQITNKYCKTLSVVFVKLGLQVTSWITFKSTTRTHVIVMLSTKSSQNRKKNVDNDIFSSRT